MTSFTSEIIDGGSALRLSWPDGSSARFHALWLRDNALDPETRSASNGQRLITLLDLPEGMRISASSITEDTLSVTFAPENKTVEFPSAWLRAHSYDRSDVPVLGRLAAGVETWDKSLDPNHVSGDFTAIQSDDANRREWLSHAARFGFAKITGGPIESGALLKVAALFGYVRETNYGP